MLSGVVESPSSSGDYRVSMSFTMEFSTKWGSMSPSGYRVCLSITMGFSTKWGSMSPSGYFRVCLSITMGFSTKWGSISPSGYHRVCLSLWDSLPSGTVTSSLHNYRVYHYGILCQTGQ